MNIQELQIYQQKQKLKAVKLHNQNIFIGLGACVICRRPQKREGIMGKISNIRIGRSPIFGIQETLQTEQKDNQNTRDNGNT